MGLQKSTFNRLASPTSAQVSLWKYFFNQDIERSRCLLDAEIFANNFYESVPLSIDLHKMVSKLICLLKMTVFTTEMHSQLFLRRNVFLAKKCLTVIRMVKQGVDGGIIDKTFIQEHSWMKVLFILLFYNSV